MVSVKFADDADVQAFLMCMWLLLCVCRRQSVLGDINAQNDGLMGNAGSLVPVFF